MNRPAKKCGSITIWLLHSPFAMISGFVEPLSIISTHQAELSAILLTNLPRRLVSEPVVLKMLNCAEFGIVIGWLLIIWAYTADAEFLSFNSSDVSSTWVNDMVQSPKTDAFRAKNIDFGAFRGYRYPQRHVQLLLIGSPSCGVVCPDGTTSSEMTSPKQ